MATVYTLPIEDDVAAPALELLRRSVQPSSKTLPHITVRYSRKDAYFPSVDLYGEFVADEVTLLEPATFDHQGSQRNEVGTVFFRCLSDQLEYLQYKPDFPQSIFHISVYDGAASAIAAQALKALREFPWDLKVSLPRTRLSPGPHKLAPGAATLTASATDLLRTLGFGADALESNEIRPHLWRALCTHLHENLSRGSHPPGVSIESHARDDREHEQGAFWSRVELMDDMTRHRALAAERGRLRKRGAFMTPPEVAYDIVKGASRILGSRDVVYGDPSSGGGIFLAALLRQIGQQRIKSATLVDSDRASAAVAADRWGHLGYSAAVDDFVSAIVDSDIFTEADGTSRSWYHEQPDLIITNPPYVRSQDLDDDDVARWRSALNKKLRLRVDVRSDLYAYFVLASHEWLADDGIGVWLLPNEFMFTNYGETLRNYLTHNVTLLKVHTYDGPSVFANARVSSCAVFYAKRAVAGPSLVEFSAGGSIENPLATRSVSIAALAKAPKWHTIADEGVPTPSERTSGTVVGPSIGDRFKVRRGIATGANALFVVDEAQAERFGPGAAAWLKPVLPRARDLTGPVVEVNQDGRPLLPKIRWLIDSAASLHDIEESSPELAQYLREIESEATSRTLVARRKPFYRQETNRPARFFFSYMSRDVAPTRRFYLNRSTAVALNNYLVLEPKPDFAEWIDQAPGRDFAVLTALREVDASAMARGGRVYVEGLTKIEPRELASMPFPMDIGGPKLRQARPTRSEY